MLPTDPLAPDDWLAEHPVTARDRRGVVALALLVVAVIVLVKVR